jgi:23S rRNA pseudouridine1911/1915/1917 synthase
MLARGAVLLNGRRAPKGALVAAGDQVEVAPAPQVAALEPDPGGDIGVLYEDADVVVVNKPAPMPCHPLRPGERGTVMNTVAARFPDTATAGDKPLEGGLVHRLDNGTSGAMLIARTPAAFAAMRAAIRAGAIRRTYLALVSGNPPAQLDLTIPIAHHPKNPRRMVATAEASARIHPRRAVTHVEMVRRIGKFTLLSVTPSTGTRHQIRVHLADAGFPIVGDVLYGGDAISELPDRFWLHLKEIEFESPSSGVVKIEAPLPPELSRMIEGRRRAPLTR